jgi:glutaredoxin 3
MFNGTVALLALILASFTVPDVRPPQGKPHGRPQYCATQERHDLVLYYTTYCPYSQKVLRYLQQIHKSVPMVSLDNNPKEKAKLIKEGGKAQVPCLFIDGRAMYESGDIINWLSQHQNELDPA